MEIKRRDSRTGSDENAGTMIGNGAERIGHRDGIALIHIRQSLGDAIMVRVALDNEFEDRVLWLGCEGKRPVLILPTLAVEHQRRRLPRLKVDAVGPFENIVMYAWVTGARAFSFSSWGIGVSIAT